MPSKIHNIRRLPLACEFATEKLKYINRCPQDSNKKASYAVLHMLFSNNLHHDRGGFNAHVTKKRTGQYKKCESSTNCYHNLHFMLV